VAEPVILVDVDERVATVTLNRPESRNALNSALQAALWETIGALGDDDAVDVVVLTGADPAFCAGVDLKELADGSSAGRGLSAIGATASRRDTNGLYRFFPVIDKPIIGAVNGVAVTGGLEVALQCTILVASELARFADTHARVGIMPGGGITVLLAQSIGLRRAIEMSLTGNFMTAAEAHALGLVNHVVGHDELLPFARALAADIASNDQRGVRRLLQHYRQMANAATLDEAHLIEGYMAEMWQPDFDAERREAVMGRGRSQTGSA